MSSLPFAVNEREKSGHDQWSQQKDRPHWFDKTVFLILFDSSNQLEFWDWQVKFITFDKIFINSFTQALQERNLYKCVFFFLRNKKDSKGERNSF